MELDSQRNVMETSKFQHKHMEIQGKNHDNHKVFSMTEYTINKVNLDGLSIQEMGYI